MLKQTPPPKRDEVPPLWPFPAHPLPASIPPEPRHER
jgi:hypothetical protein